MFIKIKTFLGNPSNPPDLSTGLKVSDKGFLCSISELTQQEKSNDNLSLVTKDPHCVTSEPNTRLKAALTRCVAV